MPGSLQFGRFGAALGASILVLLASACGADQPTSAPAPSTSALPSTPTAEPTPEATASEEPSDEPTRTARPRACQMAEPSARLLSSSWSRVMASRGASDHEEMVDNFYDDAKEFSDDVKDDCEGELVEPRPG